MAKKLGINLSSRKEGELFKWFLACLLFGKPIQQEIAERAYARLLSAGLRNPDRGIDAGWEELVRLLDDRASLNCLNLCFEFCDSLFEKFERSPIPTTAQVPRCLDRKDRCDSRVEVTGTNVKEALLLRFPPIV